VINIDQCEVHGCKNVHTMKYIGKYICQQHWELYCKKNDERLGKKRWTSQDFVEYIKKKSNKHTCQKTLAGISCFLTNVPRSLYPKI